MDPERKKGNWSCSARADCNDNIPGNCPEDPLMRFAFGAGVAKNLGNARNIAKSNATHTHTHTHTHGCQPKHVSCKCTGPKGGNIAVVVSAGGHTLSGLKVGDRVVFLKAPDWLLKDLPADEQDQIRSFVGKATKITEVDQYGYFWIGFGSQADDGEESNYAGHSFAVTADCLQLAG